MLKISGLSKAFGASHVLKHIDMQVDSGELVALLGPSGSGKTTLLRILAGFEDADTGEVRIDNRIVVHDRISVAPERRRIAMVFQDYALFPHLNVRENVAFGLPRSGDRSARVHEALEAVNMMDSINAMPHQLSGGQQQRIALARALAPGPQIVLMDEPFSNLDPALRAQVRADVRKIFRASGVTAILVTHDQEEALSIADRVAVLLDGALEQYDTPQAIYNQPTTEAVASFVGDAHFLPGTVREDGFETDGLGIVPLQPGTSTPGSPGTVMLRPELLSVHPVDTHIGVPAKVSHTVFFGRDQRLDLELASGQQVVARCGTETTFMPGEHVRVAVNRPLHLMPEGSSAGEDTLSIR